MQQWNQNEMHELSKVKNGFKYAANSKRFQATVPWQDFSPTAVKFHDISKFSRQVVTLYTADRFLRHSVDAVAGDNRRRTCIVVGRLFYFVTFVCLH